MGGEKIWDEELVMSTYFSAARSYVWMNCYLGCERFWLRKIVGETYHVPGYVCIVSKWQQDSNVDCREFRVKA